MTLFEIAKDFCDLSDFEWVNCAAIFSDFSYKKKENFEYLKSVYPQISLENISSSIPGINARKINSALAYYAEDIFYVFNLIKTRNLESLDQVHQIIEDEINSFIEDFSKNSKYFEEKNLYFYEIKSKFHLGSTVASLVSKMNPNKTFVFMQIIDGKVKFSARNQSGNQDVGKLMKDCVKDLDNASGGGHVMAAAAKIDLKDLTVFKKRLLE
jgi:nanoRNase/pAp phosphatase (c-di-AMP/oligoRNAs hydrolase)